MTRYFYTDPLAAAFMAHHHGFDIRVDNPEGEVFLEKTLILGLREWRQAIAASTGYRFYIHPDSEHLLWVQLGDIVSMTKAMDKYAVVNVEELRDAFNEAGDYKIIERNGHAFMWPEYEESEGA